MKKPGKARLVFGSSRFVALIPLALLAACAGGSPPSSTVDAGDDGSGTPADSGDVAVDTDSADVADDAADADDGSGDGGTDAGDGSGGGDAGAGDIGEICTGDEDCELLCIFAIPELETGWCTIPCVDDAGCPTDFVCELVESTGADGQSVCVPDLLCYDPDGDLYGIGPECEGPDCEPDNGAVNPRATEVCDGFDNDCDTIVDDNPAGVGDACSTGFQGACADGVQQCVDGLADCVQQTLPTDETCDGVDNDCDGVTDEAADGGALTRTCYDGPAGTQGVGTCVGGVQTCAAAEFGSCVGQVVPGVEACDGVDNDCDGTSDDGTGAATWYPDADGDGFGDATATPRSDCTQPDGWVSDNRDCDDSTRDVAPGADEVVGDGVDQDCDGLEACYADRDLDGFWRGETVESDDFTCSFPGLLGVGDPSGDCDDSNATAYPGSIEVPGDEVDQDCDGTELCYVDRDNDGARTDAVVPSPNVSCSADGEAVIEDIAVDCDDASRTIYPGAPELCDGLDQDCDTVVDNDVVLVTWYVDLDRDGFGSPTAPTVEACSLPVGYAANDDDCNDDNPAVRPGVAEITGDGRDQNCDGAETCYVDTDLDGFRTPAGAVLASLDADCDDRGEASATAPATDCNDIDPTINPDADERPADGVDQNCDGGELCYVDADADGFRAGTSTVASIDPFCFDTGEASASTPLGDCDDSDRGRNPNALEVCDGVDQNCNTLIDDGTTLRAWYPDADGDGYGDALGAPVSSCAPVADRVTDNSDCDDDAASVNPGQAELPGDEIDQNCDAREVCYPDSDGDGYRPSAGGVVLSTDRDCRDAGEALASAPATDCDDSASGRNPGATEIVADGTDQNCDGAELCFVDADSDGYRPDATSTVISVNTSCADFGEAGTGAAIGDCDDAARTVNPGAAELCDGIDQNCNVTIDDGIATVNWYLDSDGDTFGSATAPAIASCSPVAGRVTTNTDCDDSASAINPGAAEVAGDNVDQNCDGRELCYQDADDDNFRPVGSPVILSLDADCNDTGEADGAAGDNDCNDLLASVYPGATEVVGDNIDQSCDGAEICFVDADQDGYRADGLTVPSTDSRCLDAGEASASTPGGDCDDASRTRNPGAVEVCDGIDQNCNTLIDDGTSVRNWYVDADGDGYGAVLGEPITSCAPVADRVTDNSDCDDDNSAVFPTAGETAGDALDQNCDNRELCFADADNDGFRAPGGSVVLSLDTDCDDTGEAALGVPETDCDDTAAAVRPGATELPADGVDQDCDRSELCFVDADGDGYRPDGTATRASPNLSCSDAGEAGTGAPVGDCNDAVASINPGATEVVGDGADQDCNGGEVCYADGDDDGYRPDLTSRSVSTDTDCADAGEGSASDGLGDCNDSQFLINPGAVEGIADGIDQDCNGLELCFADADNDGYRPLATATTPSVNLVCTDSGEALPTDPTGDCNDANSTAYPGATEVPDNGSDDSCDGFELCYADADDDGYRPNSTATVSSPDATCTAPGEARASDPTGDCDETLAAVRPGAVELVGDSVDQNCDGVEICYANADNDPRRTDTTVVSSNASCADSGEATAAMMSGDCNDSNAAIYPGATEVAGDQVDQNCDGSEICYVDADNDGWRMTSTVVSGDSDCADSGEGVTADPSVDCDDARADRNPSLNADGDSYNSCVDCDDSAAFLPDGRYEVTGTGGYIFDNSSLAVSVNVPRAYVIEDVNLTVNLQHTYTGDLTMYLRHPDLTEIFLFNRYGGSGDNFVGSFDDEAGTAVSSGSAPYSGSYRPDNALSGFDGRSTAGNWRFRVDDNAGIDEGPLNSWTLSFDVACP